MLISRFCVFYLTYLGPVLCITVRNFVYQKDMSEHCRRRVVPSVFLGRHVDEAHSQILHFSRMELPYSCFISVRAESGNNIVLVVQLVEEGELLKDCAESPGQLLVYEMSETFGGYWGPLPDSFLRQEPVPSRLYIRKTTQRPTTPRMRSEVTTTTTVAETVPTRVTGETGNFVRVEVPIVDVNISSVLVNDGDAPRRQAFDPDEAFDLLFDVTPPRSRTDIKSKILPVVQFAIKPKGYGRGGEPRFDLEYEAPPFESNKRFTLPRYGLKHTKRWKAAKTNFYVNKLFNYELTSSTFDIETENSDITDVTHDTKDDTLSTLFHKTSSSTEAHSSSTPAIRNWHQIENIIRNLSESSSEINIPQKTDTNMSKLLETMSKINHNKSVYLVPNWSSLSDHQTTNFMNVTEHLKYDAFTETPTLPVKIILKETQEVKTIANTITVPLSTTVANSIVRNFETKSSVSTIAEEYNNIYTTEKSATNLSTFSKEEEKEELEPSHEIVKENYTTASRSTQNVKRNITNSYKTNAILTGSMVGHESWENVVQAAPEMAVLLNKTVNPTMKSNTNPSAFHAAPANSTTATSEKNIRNKRKLEPIPIENVRPHRRSTVQSLVTTATTKFRLADMQDFAQLVELQDDELHDRVALRYLRQYVGPALYNICDNEDSKSRHIFIFNSSRIVIAINNFTMERMTVVLTPAQTLIGASLRCPSTSLECQVYGNRICIDAMNACDGVPNCGAYDIYDEDRLMCGAAGGLQHNVYLAAVTFLALLLTLLYAVLYWLKRCVPDVSKAFFIYTNGAENILYLETIMRSPHAPNEDDSFAKYAFHQSEPGTEYFSSNFEDKSHENFIRRIIRACFKCCRRKGKDDIPQYGENESISNFDRPRRMYSFAELELTKMSYETRMTDTAVQTGESLEMTQIHNSKATDSETLKATTTQKAIPSRPLTKFSVSDETVDEDFQKHVNELNMLKFFKEVRSDPVPSTSRDVSSRPRKLHKQPSGSIEETVIRSHLYDKPKKHKKPIEHVPHKTIARTSGVPTETLALKPPEKRLRFDEEATAIPYDYDQDGSHETSNIALVDRDDTEHFPAKTEEPSSGSGREFKRFWQKSKKSKKKAAHLSLR